MGNGKQSGATHATATWKPAQAYVMAVVCLLIGIAVGYLVRGSAATGNGASADAGIPSATSAETGTGSQVTPEQLKHMADKQAEPVLTQLKANPNDPSLLAQAGNVYYDAQQFRDAIDYYQKSLKIQPTNTNVRTDMATAYWYLGDPDRAIAEFQTVLKAEPTKANALFNLGVVQWQGKMDANGAVATWEKLLDTNPTYENKEKVQQLIAQVKKHSGIKPGTKTDKPAM